MSNACGGANAWRSICNAAQAIRRKHRDPGAARKLRRVLGAMPASGELYDVTVRAARQALTAPGDIEGRDLADRSDDPAEVGRAMARATGR